MKKYFNLFDFRQKVDYKIEVLSGLTVALALVPEAVAFALLAGLSPLTGLYAAFMMGLITAIFGGRPGMISGATGAVAVIFVGLISELRVLYPTIELEQISQYIFLTVIFGGILQLIFGVLRLGKFIRLVPQPVIFGFVNGLAVIIFMAQLPQFTVDSNDPNAPWMQGEALYVFSGLVALAILIVWGLPKLTKAFPSGLAAILVIFGLVYFLDIDTSTVGDIASVSGGFPVPSWPKVPFDWQTITLIFPYAAIMAGVGLIESLLTLNIVDEITQTRGRGNKEAVAQGSANILSGLFLGMGGCAMIGQSLINISSGSRARLSGIVAAVMLLAFVMFGAPIIERLPMAALTGLMIMVSVGTFEWASFRALNKMPKSDIFVMVLVTLVTVFSHNLAIAVLIGVIISALVFAWDNSKRIRARKHVDSDGVKYYEIYGPLFFGSVSVFNEKFDVTNDPMEVVIDFEESRVVDMSAIEALNGLTERYAAQGKRIRLRHLSADCLKLLSNAEKIIDVNVMEDPRYKVVTDDL
jgi:SulP family sulfate permease